MKNTSLNGAFISVFLAFIVVIANSSNRPFLKIIALVLLILTLTLGVRILRAKK